MSPKWVLFTKRTEDPKLRWLERELDKLDIPHRRNGYSFHGPILEVPEDRLEEADTILRRRIGSHTVDDIRDDHPRWVEEMRVDPFREAVREAAAEERNRRATEGFKGAVRKAVRKAHKGEKGSGSVD